MTLFEFEELDTTELHLVPAGANGFSPLLAKARADLEDVAFEEACKAEAPCDGWATKFVSAEDRRKMASDGVATGNGDFPIPDEGHLRSAVGRLVEYKGDKTKAKAHIIKRARALGLTNLLPKEWNVTKEASPDESLSQTRSNEDTLHEGSSPDPGDGGEPRHVAAEDRHVDTSDGTGDTAPDKTLPRGEALSQTEKAAPSEDGTGSHETDDDAKEKDEAESQTEGTEKKKSPDSDPGSPEWEAKDVALGEKAESLIEQLGEVVRTFTEREKAEGGSAKKEGRRLSGKTDGAIRRCIQALQDLLENTEPSASKESEDMTNDELIKLLDERDAARRAEKSEKKDKAAKKAAKAAAKETAKGAVAPEADDALAKAQAELAELQKTVNAMASQDAKRPMVNAAGLSAVLRDTEALKSFDDNVSAAEERLSKARLADDTYAIAAAKSDLEVARHQRTAIKMIAAENARERDPQMTTRSLRGQGVPLLSNRHAIPEDVALRAI